jgi:hypothetical protein
MIACSAVHILVYVLFLEVEEGAGITGVTANEVLKRVGPYLSN